MSAPAAGRVPEPLMIVQNLTKTFPVRRSLAARIRGGTRPVVHALTDVDLTVARGETLGIVGESGCGKSTLARCLVRLTAPIPERSISTGTMSAVSSAPICAGTTGGCRWSSRTRTARSTRA